MRVIRDAQYHCGSSFLFGLLNYVLHLVQGTLKSMLSLPMNSFQIPNQQTSKERLEA
jgi:hypothetical protein